MRPIPTLTRPTCVKLDRARRPPYPKPNLRPAQYNVDYNWANGAQTDLRYQADPVAEMAWKKDWSYVGCYYDDNRMLGAPYSTSSSRCSAVWTLGFSLSLWYRSLLQSRAGRTSRSFAWLSAMPLASSMPPSSTATRCVGSSSSTLDRQG